MNENTTSDEWATAHALARATGSAERHIEKWCHIESVPTSKRGSRTFYAKNHAIAVIRDRQRPRDESEPDTGLKALADKITLLERREDMLNAILSVLNKENETMVDAIVANAPQDVPVEVPEKCPAFSAEQAAWLITNINKPWTKGWKIVPKAERDQVEKS